MTTPTDIVASLRAELAASQEALSRAEAELAAERRQRRLLQEISRTLELEQLLYILGEEIARLRVFDGYFINLVDQERRNLLCAKVSMPASHEGLIQTYQHFKFPLRDDSNARAFHERRTIHVHADELEEHGELISKGFERWLASSMVIVPISYGDTAIGTVIAFRQTGTIDPERIAEFEQRLLFFNEQIRNALLYTELKRQEQAVQSALEEHQRFLQFVSQINNLTSPELIHQAIVDEFVRGFGFQIASISTEAEGALRLQEMGCMDERYQMICDELKALHGNPVPLSQDAGAASIAYLQNTPIYIPDAQKLLHLPMAERDRRTVSVMQGVRTVLHMPIRRQQRPIGVLGLYSMEEPLALDDANIKIIELLCAFIGSAIGNAELYSVIGEQKGQVEELNQDLQGKIERLNQMVNKDPLTGLNNFGAFKSELYRRANEAERRSEEQGLSLVVLDVDHFKHFNDTYGHIAGNCVLQETAARIERVIRKMDVACRFGGEEFVVILPRCGTRGARRSAERIRRAIAETPFEVGDQQVTVTVSVGCAQLIERETVEEFIARADSALYRAKAAGRNCVEVATD